MGAKLTSFLEIMLLIVLIISPQAAVARKLAQTSNAITPFDLAVVKGNPLNPNRPFCGGKIYSNCIAHPKPKRKCSYKNKCSHPPAQPEP